MAKFGMQDVISGGIRSGSLKPYTKPKKKKGKVKTDKTDKMQMTMHEFKHGDLHSGSKTGPKVTSRKQAIAIGLSQARRAK